MKSGSESDRNKGGGDDPEPEAPAAEGDLAFLDRLLEFLSFLSDLEPDDVPKMF